MMMKKNVAAAAQPLSPAALPLRGCVWGGLCPCSRLRKQQNRDNKTTKKKQLKKHATTGHCKRGGAAAPPPAPYKKK